jgi:hypothetical protein
MLKIVSFSTLLIFVSHSTYSQFFKHGKKQYKKIVNTWNISDYNSFIEKYPKSKYQLDISQRIICYTRNKEYDKLISSKDTNSIKNYLNKYDSCSFCSNYIPQKALNHLGGKLNDLSIMKDSLESLRAYFSWIQIKYNVKVNDFNICQDFLTKYPKSYFAKQANDSLFARKDRYYWNQALKDDNSASYKIYIDSVSKGVFIKEARIKYDEFQFAENLILVNSHKELVEGLDVLKSFNSYSKFISVINSKLEVIEGPEFNTCLKKKNLLSWFNFEMKFSNGYYFKKADEQVRFISKIKKDTKRSPYGTFVWIENEDDFNKKIIYSNATVKKEINLNANQSESFILPNGIYNFKSTSSQPNFIGIDKTVTLDGTDNTFILHISSRKK